MSENRERRLLLELIGGKSAPVELPRQGVLTIGSDAARADFLVDGQGVADVHCAIGKSKSGGFALKDLGSQYGTLVNGKNVTSVRLEPGDLILLGSRRLRVLDPDATVVDARPPEPAAKAPTSTSLRETSIAPPIIRGYRIEQLLGRGGMGEVWLAVQEPLERKVALKLLSRSLSADADFVRRFLAEARAAASLNHPNVVVVYDAGEDQGHHYLAMEFMERGNLESRVAKEGALPWKDALDVIIEAARGLQYAESKNIVHRDIKPANLMTNANGTTKIADLGLAAHLDAEATQSEGKKIFGTPHFISPEQARGERVDCRSDLYSLGATAYRLLSGRTPFEGATTRDILRGHFTEPPKPLAQIAPSVPAPLAAAVHRLLEKKPEERYANAAALLADLDRVRGGGAAPRVVVSAGAPSKSSSSGGLITLVALAVLAGAAYFIWNRRSASTPADPSHDDRSKVALAPPPDTATPPLVDVQAPTKASSDEDSKLKVRELKAELAYRDLAKDLDDAGRKDALEKLAVEFAGTTVAGRAQQEAGDLALKIESDAKAAGERGQVSDALFTAMRESVATFDPLDVGPALRALFAVPGQEALAADDSFKARRMVVVADLLARGATAAKAALAQADRLSSAGDFEQLSKCLEAVVAGLDLPELPAELESGTANAVSELDGLLHEARSRVTGLDALRERYAVGRRRADERAVAEGLGGPNGFEKELAALDFAAMKTRLDALRARLVNPEAKSFLDALSADVERAKSAIDLVANEFAKGTWRRKTLLDPRRNKSATRNAVSADAGGVSVEIDGQIESIPWSSFGAHPKELQQLVFERLSREYTAPEIAAISSLMRLSSVVDATQTSAQMMQTAKRATFSEGELRDMLEGFALAKNWAQDAAQRASLESETAAAEQLGRALRQIDAGQWSSASVTLEHFALERRDTLIFHLLTGGPPSDDAPASSNAPASGDGTKERKTTPNGDGAKSPSGGRAGG